MGTRTRHRGVTASLSVYLCLSLSLLFFSSSWADQSVSTEVPVLLEKLKSPDKAIRIAAWEVLVSIGPDVAQEALSALKAALQDKEELVRLAAVWAIGNVGPEAAPEAISILREALKDQKERVRAAAASSLGGIGYHSTLEAVPALTQALKDQQMSVRIASAEALGRIGPDAKEAVPVLEKVLHDPALFVRFAAAKALGRMGRAAKDAIPTLQEKLQDPESLVRFSAAMALGNIGKEAPQEVIPILTEALQNQKAFVRHAAAMGLANISMEASQEAIPDLTETLQDPDAEVRRAGVKALSRIGLAAKGAVGALIRVLQDSDTDVRFFAATALGNLDGEVTQEVILTLTQVLHDSDTEVRRAAAKSLGRLGRSAKDAVPTLKKKLQDPAPLVRFFAATALVTIDQGSFEEVEPILREGLKHHDPRIRRTAAETLGRMGQGYGTEENIQALTEASQDQTNRELRRVAVAALGRIGSPNTPKAVVALAEALQDPSEEVRREAARALGSMKPADEKAIYALIEALQDLKANVRSDAAEALGRIGPGVREMIPDLADELTDALTKALQDSNDNVRQRAAVALGRTGSEAQAILSVLKGILDHKEASFRRSAVEVLGNLGSKAKEAVPWLIEKLQDTDEKTEVRQAAASALGRADLEDKRVIQPLIAALRDPEENVRANAANALGELGAAAKEAIPALTEMSKDRVYRGVAAEALANIAQDLQDKKVTDAIGPLKDAYRQLSISPDSELSTHQYANTVKRTVESLELVQFWNFYEPLLHWIREHPLVSGISAGYGVLLLSCSLLLWIHPLWLLRINDMLRPYADVELPAWLGKIKIPLRSLLLVGLFHHRPRVLDAWIAQHLAAAREEFCNKRTVKDRRVYIRVPVRCDGNLLEHVTTEQVRPAFSRGKGCVLIWGEGGAGKTSLACQIARWAMAEERDSRLCTHAMLPVLIEDDLNTDVSSGKHPLVEAARGELRALLRVEDPIPEEFILELLKRRRVLVIVDRLSEMDEMATRKQIRPGNPDFPGNALLVTSRFEEPLDGVPKLTIQPLRIQGNRLSSFMEAYLIHRGKRELFPDTEYFDACRQLSLMVGERNITVLLAKLYAEQMIAIAIKEGATDNNLPKTIPDLMLQYLNEVNRSGEHLDRLVHRVAKIIAWETLKTTYRPTLAKRDAILAALKSETDPEALLTYVQTRLQLVETVGVSKDRIRFTLDPLAEYLAALYVVELYKDNGAAWREFLARADCMPEAPEAIVGFLLAVRDCCIAPDTEAKVPSFVPRELAQRAQPPASLTESNSLL